MLSTYGWFHGITSLGVLIIYLYFGSFFIYKSKKTDAKLLFYLGIMIIITGLINLRITSDFLTILITGKNSNYSYFFHFILGWIWAPIAGGIGLYIATELLIPKKKWYVLSIYSFLLILLFIVWMYDPASNVVIIYPKNSGEELVESEIIIGSPSSIIIFIMLPITIGFGGFGNLIKSFQSKGILRKKFLSLSIAWFLTHTFVVLEAFAPLGFSILFKFGFIISLWFFYYGLREEPESIEIITEKEIQVQDGLFIIRKRPTMITEEEVSISKEKKICLVCKGKISGYDVYICPGCDTLYCEKCAHAIETLENACWVCNEPIDKSKPVKITKYTEKKKDIEPVKRSHINSND